MAACPDPFYLRGMVVVQVAVQDVLERYDNHRRSTPPPKIKEEKERTNGKESLWLLEAPVRKIILQMHTPARTSQCWGRQTPAWTRSVHLDAPGRWRGQQPDSGTADPRSSQTGHVIRGLR